MTAPPDAGAHRAATAAEVTPLAQALAAAFARDPVWSWLLRDDRTRRRRLERFFAVELEHVILPAGTAWTTGDLAGGVLTTPPDRWRVPIAQQARHAPTLMSVFGRAVPRALAFLARLESRHPREPHLYIPYAGVRPERQGEGVGRGLMERAIAEAGGLACYLEATSPDNARLYRRLGFEDVGTMTFLGSPPVALMRRPPGS